MKQLGTSRGVLALEWTVCFGFLVLWGIFEIIDIPGLVKGNFEQTMAYLNYRGPVQAFFGGLEFLVAGLGLFGIVAGFRLLTKGVGIPNRLFAIALAIGFLFYGVANVSYHAWLGSTIGIDYWRGFTLMALLPAIGFLHLHYLSRTHLG